jgi:3-hydroxyacyl-CoA dehydrogenase/enoyl-CoA hydratase/3-hydroxybutyryl-CoA epimerase
MDLNTLATIREESGDDPAGPVRFHHERPPHPAQNRTRRDGPQDQQGRQARRLRHPGTCAGIGTEIALACHRRFMADNPKAKIGLPEILVGIFPGGGGTTRYSRMVGAMAAAPVLLEGKMLDPKPRPRARA